MSAAVKIPADIDDAILNLKGLGELVTASEWKRAAIVWAFTTDKATGRGNRTSSGALSARAFADLAISGLSSQETVRKYRRAWAKAIADGFATDVNPGDLVDLPDLDWTSYFKPAAAPRGRSSKGATKPGKWDKAGWQGINRSPRLAKMSQRMRDALDGLVGVDGEFLTRIGLRTIDLAVEENKERAMAQLMDAVTQFASAFKTRQRSEAAA